MALVPSEKLVHIGDRDSDMFELFELCDKTNTNFVIRVSHNRRTGLNGELLYDSAEQNSDQLGYFDLDVMDKDKSM